MEGLDFIGLDGNGQVVGQGNVAQRLLANGMDVGALRTNATLRKDEWLLLDQTVIEVARERFNAVSDLFDRNLILNVPNGMGTTVVQHETMTEMIQAEITMDGVTRTPYDRVTFALVSTPLPVIHRDFTLNARALAASRKGGTPLDTTQTAEATRQVVERIEDLLINGNTSGDVFGFGTLTAQMFGYTNRTSRNTVSLSTQWDASAATGETIVNDVLSMIAVAHGDRQFGPYVLYIPTNYWVELFNDFKTNSDKTTMQRISEISGIEAIKPIDRLSDDNVLLVQMSRSNVDMAVGMQPTTVSWEEQGGLVLMFKVMAIMVPRIKLDSGARSGVIHLS